MSLRDNGDFENLPSVIFSPASGGRVNPSTVICRKNYRNLQGNYQFSYQGNEQTGNYQVQPVVERSSAHEQDEIDGNVRLTFEFFHRSIGRRRWKFDFKLFFIMKVDKSIKSLIFHPSVPILRSQRNSPCPFGACFRCWHLSDIQFANRYTVDCRSKSQTESFLQHYSCKYIMYGLTLSPHF